MRLLNYKLLLLLRRRERRASKLAPQEVVEVFRPPFMVYCYSCLKFLFFFFFSYFFLWLSKEVEEEEGRKAQ